jgi:hypothetical protein
LATPRSGGKPGATARARGKSGAKSPS